MKRNEFVAVEIVLSERDLWDAFDLFLKANEIPIPEGKKLLHYRADDGRISILVLSEKEKVPDEKTTGTP